LLMHHPSRHRPKNSARNRPVVGRRALDGQVPVRSAWVRSRQCHHRMWCSRLRGPPFHRQCLQCRRERASLHLSSGVASAARWPHRLPMSSGLLSVAWWWRCVDTAYVSPLLGRMIWAVFASPRIASAPPSDTPARRACHAPGTGRRAACAARTHAVAVLAPLKQPGAAPRRGVRRLRRESRTEHRLRSERRASGGPKRAARNICMRGYTHERALSGRGCTLRVCI